MTTMSRVIVFKTPAISKTFSAFFSIASIAAVFMASLLTIIQENYLQLLLPFACFFMYLCWRTKDDEVPNWPIVGMLPVVLLHIHRVHNKITEVLRNNGCNFMFNGPWFTRMDILCTCDPANINHIFNINFSNYPKGPENSRIFDIFGISLLTTDFETWRLIRKITHHLMSSKRFRTFVARTSQAKVKDLVHVIKHVANQDQGVVDLQDVFQRFTLDNTCILVFGVDPGSLSVNFPMVPVAKALDDTTEALAFRNALPESWWKLLKWLKIGKEKKLAEAWKIFDDFINPLISTRREELNKSTSTHAEDHDCEQGVDMLSSYINVQVLEDELALTKSEKFLRGMALNLILAGRDTTSAALTWFLWMVSINPEVEAKILEELRANSPELRDGWQGKIKVFHAEELSECVYLHAALCETLRLFPPVPFEYASVVKQDVVPSGHTVEPGTKILIPLYTMGRMESIWGKDCLEFKPERWITEKGKLKFEPSYKFMAFNSGPRICLGKEVAFSQMRSAAATLLFNFTFQVLEGHPRSPTLSIVLLMEKGLIVKVKERETAKML